MSRKIKQIKQLKRVYDRIVHFDDRSREFPARAAIRSLALRSRTWTCYVNLDQGVEGACFPADALIRLADGGLKRICDIRPLDRVVTAEGNAHEVMAVFVRRAKELASVEFRGHISLLCTPDHPIRTRRGYVAAKDLVVGDCVAVTRGRAAVDNVVAVPAGCRGGSRREVNTGGVPSVVSPVPDSLEKTEKFGRLIGLYAAEGCTTENKVVWAYGTHEEHTLVAETVSLISDVFGAEARLQRRPNNSIYVVLYGKRWRKLFDKLVPGASKHGTKRLSSAVAGGTDAYRRSILFGWLDGDGHARRSEINGVSVCRQLALDMHAIANDIGLAPVIRARRPSMNRWAKTRQIAYEVVIPTGGGGNGPEVTPDATWRKVTGVVTADCDDWVYNLKVAEDESYVADGIGVHNCAGFAVSHEAASTPAVVPGITNAVARQVYKQAQKLDEWPDEGYDGTSVLAAMKAGKARGWWAGYRWAFGERDLAFSLGYLGPAVLGVNWYSGMETPDAAGQIHATGEIMGGHSILCIGYDAGKKLYRLHNSWGKDWGIGGDCFISASDMVKLLSENGEAAIPMKRSVPK